MRLMRIITAWIGFAAQKFEQAGIEADEGEAGEERRLAGGAEAQRALFEDIKRASPAMASRPPKATVKSGPQMAARRTAWMKFSGSRTKPNRNGAAEPMSERRLESN